MDRTISERQAKQMFGAHMCHWPGCPQDVPPAMWGCKPHWFKLPKMLRDRIWATYVPGQEITKTPSQAYLDAAYAVQLWINSNLAPAPSPSREKGEGKL